MSSSWKSNIYSYALVASILCCFNSTFFVLSMHKKNTLHKITFFEKHPHINITAVGLLAATGLACGGLALKTENKALFIPAVIATISAVGLIPKSAFEKIQQPILPLKPKSFKKDNATDVSDDESWDKEILKKYKTALCTMLNAPAKRYNDNIEQYNKDQDHYLQRHTILFYDWMTKLNIATYPQYSSSPTMQLPAKSEDSLYSLAQKSKQLLPTEIVQVNKKYIFTHDIFNAHFKPLKKNPSFRGINTAFFQMRAGTYEIKKQKNEEESEDNDVEEENDNSDDEDNDSDDDSAESDDSDDEEKSDGYQGKSTTNKPFHYDKNNQNYAPTTNELSLQYFQENNILTIDGKNATICDFITSDKQRSVKYTHVMKTALLYAYENGYSINSDFLDLSQTSNLLITKKVTYQSINNQIQALHTEIKNYITDMLQTLKTQEIITVNNQDITFDLSKAADCTKNAFDFVIKTFTSYKISYINSSPVKLVVNLNKKTQVNYTFANKPFETLDAFLNILKQQTVI